MKTGDIVLIPFPFAELTSVKVRPAADSMIKVDRIVTVKRDDIIAELGKLEPKQVALFKTKFKNLVNEK